MQREQDIVEFQLSSSEMCLMQKTIQSGIMELYGLEQFYS